MIDLVLVGQKGTPRLARFKTAGFIFKRDFQPRILPQRKMWDQSRKKTEAQMKKK